MKLLALIFCCLHLSCYAQIYPKLLKFCAFLKQPRIFSCVLEENARDSVVCSRCNSLDKSSSVCLQKSHCTEGKTTKQKRNDVPSIINTTTQGPLEDKF